MPDSAPSRSDHASGYQGLDQSRLRHMLGYNLVQADIPVKKVLFKSIGVPLQLRTMELSILMDER